MKTFKLELSDEEVQILHNDLLNIGEWVKGMVAGKINSCKKRAAIAYREQLKAEGAAMVPANDDAAVSALFARPDYKNRAAKEAEAPHGV